MKKALDKFVKVLVDFNAFLLFFIVVVMLIQVITRRMGISASWTEEVCRYTYVVVGFMTWPCVVYKGGEVVISFLFDLLPKKARVVILGIYYLFAAAITALCFYSSIINIMNANDVIFVSLRWMKVNYITYFVSLGLALTTLACIYQAIRIWKGEIDVLTDMEKNMQSVDMDAVAELEELDRKLAEEGGNA